MIENSHVPRYSGGGVGGIDDYLFCSKFITSKRKNASKLLFRLEEVTSIDPQVALILMRLCGGFCKDGACGLNNSTSSGL